MASVLVTGSSSGIGLETALVLARAGHTVFATMRNLERGSELLDRSSQEKLPIQVSVMDVNSDESVARGFADIQQRCNVIDALVNNAGVERTGSIEELPLSAFQAVMETNYFGALRCIKAVIPQMRSRRNGCIVNVSSVGGRMANSPFGPYTASKFALEALSESLAQEMKSFNVRVAIVEPGIIDTPMTEGMVNRKGHLVTSLYPQQQRIWRLFATAAANGAASASMVGSKILEIIDSKTWQLRHLVGPDAEMFIAWGKGMTDEQWVELHASDDESWYTSVEKHFGLPIPRGT